MALGVVALTGNLGGERTVVVREALPMPAQNEPAAAPGVGVPAPASPDWVQRVVAQSSSAVVRVSIGDVDDDGAATDQESGRMGSGFLVHARGDVLSNAHVVGDAERATVTFDDGTVSPARVLGRDESTDLAVLRAERVPAGARPLELGRSSRLVVGDPVVAIGNPFGLDRTATIGIVSAIKRIITAPNGFDIQNVIQTDAAINTGNSGGPLLDAQGRVIGINSQIATETGRNSGIGFAVPSDTVRPVANAIIATGQPAHAWLGVTGRTLTPSIAEAIGQPRLRGVVIVSVDERGPARAAGVRPATTPPDAEIPRGGDIVVAVDGRSVTDMADVSRAVSSRAVGEGLPLTVMRDGRRVPLRITLAKRPADVGVLRSRP